MSVDVAGVQKVIDEFAAAYSAKDVERAMSVFALDPDAVMVGTGADKIRIGPDQIREQMVRDVTQADEIQLEVGEVRINGRGDVAWAFATPTVSVTAGGDQTQMPVRMTLVLILENGEWRIHNGHLSVAFAAQEEGQSYANA